LFFNPCLWFCLFEAIFININKQNNKNEARAKVKKTKMLPLQAKRKQRRGKGKKNINKNKNKRQEKMLPLQAKMLPFHSVALLLPLARHEQEAGEQEVAEVPPLLPLVIFV
jgi:hypothetical protein